jgi:hypothetical protein
LAGSKWGLTREVLEANITPEIYDILYHARLGLKALQKPTAAPTPTQPPVKPLTVVGAKTNAPAKKSIAEMDMDEYVAHRNEQERRARAR